MSTEKLGIPFSFFSFFFLLMMYTCLWVEGEKRDHFLEPPVFHTRDVIADKI